MDEIVVIGKARHGKSYAGNKLYQNTKKRNKNLKRPFPTSEGSDSMTKQIHSLDLQDVKLGDGHTFSIKYTDTPGFPDTEGPEKTIEVYNTIVKYVNDQQPLAVVWLINPVRDPAVEKEYQRYSLLMENFSESHHFCAILINSQGDAEDYVVHPDDDEEEKIQKLEYSAKSKIEKRKQVANYGLRGFSRQEPYISLAGDCLKTEMFKIVERARGCIRSSKTLIPTFDELRQDYEGDLDAAVLTAKRKQHFESSIAGAQQDVNWHKQRIHDLQVAIVSTTASAAVVGSGLAFFTFGLSAAAAATSAAAAIAGMEIAKADSEKKVLALESEIAGFKSDIAGLSWDNIREHARERCVKFCTILTALNLTDEVEEVHRKHGDLLGL